MRMLRLLQRWEVHPKRDALAAQSICLSTAAEIPLPGVPCHHHLPPEQGERILMRLFCSCSSSEGLGRGRDRDPKPTGIKGKAEVLRKKAFCQQSFQWVTVQSTCHLPRGGGSTPRAGSEAGAGMFCCKPLSCAAPASSSSL